MSSRVHSVYKEPNSIMQFLSESMSMKPDEYQVKDTVKLEKAEDFLRETSSSINCAKDTLLYRLDYSQSNDDMSLIGVHILDNLVTIYGGKKYMLRCYNNGKKFYEYLMEEKPMFIDINGTIIVYVLKNDVNKVYAINVGGWNKAGRTIGREFSDQSLNKMT
jgi:hypothetical protein